MADSLSLPADYSLLLKEIRQRVKQAQTRAVIAVNAELIQMYWEIGALIYQRQQQEGWGAGVLPRLALDLRNELPEEKGFSERNIKRMLTFHRAYPQLGMLPQAVAATEAAAIVPQPVAQLGASAKGPQAVAQLGAAAIGPQAVALFPPGLLRAVPWGHHAELLAKVREPETRQWYMQATVQHGWSRNILVMQIESAAHRRAGKTTSNFATRLPPPESDLVQQALKDPYIFDFLTLADGFQERELETGLVAHLEKFLLELGQGFAFVGRQYHLDVGDQDFYIDLLFYHLKLRRYVVIELKRGDFKPEYAGKMNFYCNVVDDRLRHESDKATIGLILCQQPNRVLAEYTLRGIEKPIGVSGFEFTRVLPAELQSSLPSIESIEQALAHQAGEDEG